MITNSYKFFQSDLTIESDFYTTLKNSKSGLNNDALISQSYELRFAFLDRQVSRVGFENLNITERCFYIKHIVENIDSSNVRESVYLSNDIKQQILDLTNKDRAVSFSQIAKKIILPIVAKSDYSGFRNTEGRLDGLSKVLLIGAHHEEAMRGGLFAAPNLGIHRIQSFLKIFGIEVEVFDSRIDSIEVLENLIVQNDYDVVGFSILHPPIDSLKLAEYIRTISPDTFIIAGGQGAAFNQDLMLTDSIFDAVSIGFGENVLLDIIMSNKKKIDKITLGRIKGLYYKPDNKIVFTGNESPYSQEDLRVFSLSIDFKDIAYPRYWAKVKESYSESHLKIMKSEGFTETIRIYTETHCPMKCDFCSSTNFLDNATGSSQKVRLLSSEDIIKIIRRAQKAFPEVKAIYFNDDEFLLSRERIMNLCKEIINDPQLSRLNYICMARVDNIDAELLEIMRRTGFGIISFGIESFSDKILEDMEKKINHGTQKKMSEISANAIEMTLKAGIIPRINFILFYPTITLADLVVNIEIARRLILRGAPPTYYTFVEPFPGARIMQKKYNEGYYYETFELNGKNLKIPTKIFPLDPAMKDLALKALAEHKKDILFFRQKYNLVELQTFPPSIDTLILFYSIYKLAGIQTVNVRLAIERLIESIE